MNSEVKRCLICGERKVHYNFSLTEFRVEKCLNCSLMRLNPQPTRHALSINAAAMDASRADAAELSELGQLSYQEGAWFFDAIQSYIGAPLSGNVLLLGDIPPVWLDLAREKGVSILQLCATQTLEASGQRSYIVETDVNDELNALLSDTARFDFVFLFDVLSQMKNPRALLQQLRFLLKPKAVVASILPSLDSVPARLMKSRWSGFQLKNFWYFSTHTLARLFYGESFGALRFAAIKKTTDLDGLSQNRHRYSKQPFMTLVYWIRFLPKLFRQWPFRISTSQVLLLATVESVHASKKLSVVMPAFNEANLIKKTIDNVLAKKIAGVDIELIIVESNSTDGTREVVRAYEGQPRVTVIWQDTPRGKGNAVRAGLEAVSGDYILIQDADDEYDIEDYDALLEPLMTGEVAFVLGARHGGGAWKMRQFADQPLVGHVLNLGHWFFATLVNVVYGLKLKDPFTMYKVFRADCLKGIRLESNRFDFDFELLIKLVQKGYYPLEIPVNYRSRSFTEGKKVNAFRDPLTWLVAIVKYKFQKQ